MVRQIRFFNVKSIKNKELRLNLMQLFLTISTAGDSPK